jgi:hypothetical protein
MRAIEAALTVHSIFNKVCRGGRNPSLSKGVETLLTWPASRERVMAKVLQCYLIRHGGESKWEAICTDYDLATGGRSFEDAYNSLRCAIHEYLEYVNSLPQAEQQKLRKRRAPFSTRLGFVLSAALTALRDHSERGKNVYTFPCAA